MTDLIERARAAAQHSREYGSGTNAPLLDELAAALEAAREDGWQPIETAPRVKKPMIVVCGILQSGYVTDPWCVWYEDGEWVRWPHKEQPTHWRPLPAPPAIDKARGRGGCGEGVAP